MRTLKLAAIAALLLTAIAVGLVWEVGRRIHFQFKRA